MSGDRFSWTEDTGLVLTRTAGGDDKLKPENVVTEGTEVKAGIRRVRDAGFWGLPEGTPIKPGMKPRKRRGKKTPSVRGNARTGGTGKVTADRPDQMPTPKKQSAAERARGIIKAFGDPGTVNERRFNARRGGAYTVEYASKAEVDRIRKLVIQRAKRAPQPDKEAVSKGRWIMRMFGQSGTGKGDIRGDKYMRSQRSWDMFVAYGGLDKDGYEREYIPCVGCGMKMSWHEDRTLTDYPKFEQDKIITTGDGGSYVTQNLMPTCAGCNAQRGQRNIWESPVFAGSKPRWWDAFEKAMRNIRGSENAKPVRPQSEHAPFYMPVPPGQIRVRRQTKSALERAEGMWDTTDVHHDSEGMSGATQGDRVSAMRFNFDGRHNTAEVFPPDVDDVTKTIVGRLIIETVDSAFGKYTRAIVIEDDGAVVIVEQDTIQQIAKGVDTDDPEAFGSDTNAGGGGGGGRGRLGGGSNGGGSRVRDDRGQKSDLYLETKRARVRRVRTRAGVAKYGLPLGSIIGVDEPVNVHMADGPSHVESRMAYSNPDRRDYANVAGSTAAQRKKFEKLTGRKVSELRSKLNYGGSQHLSWISGLPNIPTQVDVKPNGRGGWNASFSIHGSQFDASMFEVRNIPDIDALADTIIAVAMRQHARMNGEGDGNYDEDGFYPANRVKRDPTETMAGYWRGVRGVDYFVDGDDNETDTYENRKAIIDAEAEELGIKYDYSERGAYTNSTRNPVGLWAREILNAVIGTHEDMYPGFASLITGIVSDNHPSAVAYNGRVTSIDMGEYAATGGKGGFRQRTVLGMNPKYFGEGDSDYSEASITANIERLAGESRRLDQSEGSSKRVPFNSVRMQQLADENGWDLSTAFVVDVMTHELGHTVGNIVQSSLWQNGKERGESPPIGSSISDRQLQTGDNVAEEFAEAIFDLLEQYGVIKEGQGPDNNNFAGSTLYYLNQDRFRDGQEFDRSRIFEYLSSYGAYNFSELMAETWAAYQLDSEPSEFVMDLGALMEGALQTFIDREDTAERADSKRKSMPLDIITGVVFS